MIRVDWTMTAGPTAEPVSLAAIKGHCRVDHDDEDEWFDVSRRAARSLIEYHTGRGLLTQTWKAVLDDWWGDVLRLPMAAPLQSITHIKYYDTSGALTTLSSANYIVDSVSEPGAVSWAPNISLPALQSGRRGVIEVTYVVGWTTAASIPYEFVQAMFLLVGHWWSNRDAIVVSVGGTATPLPLGVDAVLAPHRVFWRPPCQG